MLDHPDEVVREAVWPVVPGGEKTPRKPVKELMVGSRVAPERVRYQLRGSYTHYYRRMLGPVLGALRPNLGSSLNSLRSNTILPGFYSTARR